MKICLFYNENLFVINNHVKCEYEAQKIEERNKKERLQK